MTSFALLFTLATIGVSETVYLIRKRRSSKKPICPIGNNCEIVLKSKYNKIFLIPNDVMGLCVYIIIAVIASFLVIGIEPISFWKLAIKILVSVASVVSLIFTFLQWKVIRAWCFWCLMSAFTIWLMAIIILISATI